RLRGSSGVNLKGLERSLRRETKDEHSCGIADFYVQTEGSERSRRANHRVSVRKTIRVDVQGGSIYRHDVARPIGDGFRRKYVRVFDRERSSRRNADGGDPHP